MERGSLKLEGPIPIKKIQARFSHYEVSSIKDTSEVYCLKEALENY